MADTYIYIGEVQHITPDSGIKGSRSSTDITCMCVTQDPQYPKTIVFKNRSTQNPYFQDSCNYFSVSKTITDVSKAFFKEGFGQ